MITDHLFENILLKPVKEGADKLIIVSGYATAAMAFNHLNILKVVHPKTTISLIVGMCTQEGLSQSNHRAFQQLMNSDYNGQFDCSYLINSPPVHSKVYTWLRNNSPFRSFLGSANYTQMAFGSYQREAMTDSDPTKGLKYFESLVSQSICCTHSEAEIMIRIYNDKYFSRLEREKRQEESGIISSPLQSVAGLESVRISLLDRYGNMPPISNLNWGQRPGREPNQAYIHLPSSIYSTNFFPERKIHFTVLTDDGKVLICTRAQDNGKAIHTPHNNSLIGEYFRNRLDVHNGAFVKKEDLLRYGRTDVIFYKIDDETYLMDFSVIRNG